MSAVVTSEAAPVLKPSAPTPTLPQRPRERTNYDKVMYPALVALVLLTRLERSSRFSATADRKSTRLNSSHSVTSRMPYH